jgi:hypothetical protein
MEMIKKTEDKSYVQLHNNDILQHLQPFPASLREKGSNTRWSFYIFKTLIDKRFFTTVQNILL